MRIVSVVNGNFYTFNQPRIYKLALANFNTKIGRKVLSSQIGVNNNTIDVSELKGIYLVNILSQEKRITKTLVVK
jgi:hypothetical protein